MATSYQNQTRTRKLIYLGLIIALFTVSLLHRQFVIEPRAYALQLRGEAKGQVELTSSATRLALFGSRGLATMILWQMTLEKQKRHQWNEMERYVQSITTLQPNFVTPWLFQSWNLAFNVSVECDRTRDKYYYVSRGLQFLAEGERRHQGTALQTGKNAKPFPGNPDMRFYMAVYYLRKIGLSDEQNAMRCLFDLSCIDPLKRDPASMRKMEGSRRVVDLVKFREFCQRYPRLVRRLNRRLRCRNPEDVLAYLERNQSLPSRFDEGNFDSAETETRLLAPEQQFPALPPPVYPRMPNPQEKEFAELFDVFTAARSWYIYAQEPLPPATGLKPEVVDPTYHRRPKMATYIFRSFPARSQEYLAENLQSEGWFDAEGWVIRDWFGAPPPVVGRETKYHSGQAWLQAFDMYDEFGRIQGILLDPQKQAELEAKAKLYEKTYLSPTRFQNSKQSKNETDPNVDPDAIDKEDVAPALKPVERSKMSPKMRESHDAYTMISDQNYTASTTNFYGHYNQCKIEKMPHVVAVRKLFFQAAERESRTETPLAIVDYKEALSRWLPILLQYSEFRELDNVMIDAAENEHRYIELLQDQLRSRLRDPQMLFMGIATFGNFPNVNAPLAATLPSMVLVKSDRRRVFPVRDVIGPFDRVYLYVTPHRQELQNFLLGVTQGAQPVPFAVSPPQRDFLLTAELRLPRLEYYEQKGWVPMIRTNHIRQARENVLITRMMRR